METNPFSSLFIVFLKMVYKFLLKFKHYIENCNNKRKRKKEFRSINKGEKYFDHLQMEKRESFFIFFVRRE